MELLDVLPCRPVSLSVAMSILRHTLFRGMPGTFSIGIHSKPSSLSAVELCVMTRGVGVATSIAVFPRGGPGARVSRRT